MRLYPKRAANDLPAKPFNNVSTNLRRIYGDVIDCFNNESHTLCAAGMRALVEGICADKGVTRGMILVPAKGGSTKMSRKNDLAGKIAGLVEKGLLTEVSAASLHEHRYLGNDAVHQLARPAEAELRAGIEIVEHTLESLYEMPLKAALMQAKRTSAKSKGKP